ncbi:MAG: hypothetical protein ACKVW3_16745 [Phycisphaerales bacterium]
MRLKSGVGVVALLAACGASSAQELMTYSMTWSEVVGGTNQPVTTPNGVIEPGEGVRIALKVSFSPGVGATSSYTPPPPPGTGTIAGLGDIFIDIVGPNLTGGSWSNFTRNAAANPGGVPGGHNWSLGGWGFDPMTNNISALGAGQFILPGNTAWTDNPIENIFRGTWTPTTYAPRATSFAPTAAAAGGNNHSSLLIQYGVDGQGDPQYVGKFIPGSFSGTGSIQIVPAPGCAGLLGAGFIVTRQRRRG